jgi:methyl-accepting chemotaxis protein
MENLSGRYTDKRVNLVNMLVVCMLAIILPISITLSYGMETGIIIAVKAVIVIIVSIIIYFFQIKETIKAFVFCIIPVIIGVMSIITNGPFLLGNHYFIFTSIAMITLYFKKELLLIFGGILNIILVIAYIINGKNLLIESSASPITLVVLSIHLNGIIILLFFLTKWGKGLVDSALNKEQQATELLNKLSSTMIKVENGSDILNSNVNIFNENINSSKESLSSIAIAVQEMAKGISEQAAGINDINDRMSIVSENAKENQRNAEKISEDATEIEDRVKEGTETIEKMNSQMGIINQAVSTSLITVTELQGDIGEINKFLAGITQIAGQTNLLALNAAIEAARAGDHGRGFAVVADEVRKLAEESGNIVKDINKIITEITKKTNLAVNKVKLGDEAVEIGIRFIESVNSNIKAIKDSFVRTSILLDKEAKMTFDMSNHFSNN